MRVTHGRHCPCTACANEDWTRADLAPCGMHGPNCPNVYAPIADSPSAWLRSLAAEATPGPWEHAVETGDEWWFGTGNQAVVRQADVKPFEGFVSVLGGDKPEEIATARLIALAPDLAVLCADAIDALRYTRDAIVSPDIEYAPGKDIYDTHMMMGAMRRADAALARFAALQPGREEERRD